MLSGRVNGRQTKTYKQEGHRDAEIKLGGKSRFRRREREQEERRKWEVREEGLREDPWCEKLGEQTNEGVDRNWVLERKQS